MNKQGFQERHMPGGKAPEYHAVTDIEVHKIKEQKKAKFTEVHLQLITKKNSNAPKNKVDVDVQWYIDVDHPTEDGECLQRTFFDWDAASIGCIFDTMTETGADTKKRLQDLLGLVSVTADKVACDALGISRVDAASYHDAGIELEKKIQSDKAFRDLLYPLMGVRRRHVFKRGVDYREQMTQAREEALRAQTLREAVVRNTTIDTAGPSLPDNSDPFEVR